MPLISNLLRKPDIDMVFLHILYTSNVIGLWMISLGGGVGGQQVLPPPHKFGYAPGSSSSDPEDDSAEDE